MINCVNSHYFLKQFILRNQIKYAIIINKKWQSNSEKEGRILHFSAHMPRSPPGLDYRVLCPWQIYTPSTHESFSSTSPCLLWSARPMIRRDYTYSPWSDWITSTACPVWLYSNLIGLLYCPWKVASEDPPFSYSKSFLKHLNGHFFLSL